MSGNARKSAEPDGKRGRTLASSPFGAKNRARLIGEYFTLLENRHPAPEDAWKHVYRLLLWVDQTTGLTHCYESDKCQPGKPWYARSLAFHDWMSSAFGASPGELSKVIDWLFSRAAEELAAYVLSVAERRIKRAKAQRKPYEGRGFPKPGDDPELVEIIREELGAYFGTEPSTEDWARVVERIRQYLSLDNKRKNLVGEGFEDVIAEIIRRVVPGTDIEVWTRRALSDLPGFSSKRKGDKPNKVDVAILRGPARTLVTAKWSVRADREKQFTTDFADYVTAESAGRPFRYVFVTNEFDPARLMRACDLLSTNVYMFDHVVHINTGALEAVYAAQSSKADHSGAANTSSRRRGDESGSIRRVLSSTQN